MSQPTTQWEEVELKDVCTPGGLVRGPFGGSLKKSDFVRSGYQVYEQRHAIAATASGARYFISAGKFADMQRFAVKPGDFIVSCSGTIGRIFRIPEDSPAGVINQALLKITVNDRIIDPDFFLAQFEWSEFQNRILDSTQGGAMQNLVGMPIFRTTPVTLPPLPQQRRIAAALRDVGGQIAALERMIAKRQAIKQGMMQQLLIGRIRLPGFSLPWQPRRLSEMLSYEQPGRYLVQTSKQLDAGRVPVLTAGKTFILGYTNETHGIYTAHPVIIFDDFTTASKYVDFDFKAKSSAMKILSARTGANLRFVYERMQLIDFPLGDHKRYWISEYSKQEILVPNEPEQAAIAEVLSDSEAEITALRERLSKARATKQGMMQQLLTGRTRLPVQEVAP